MKLFDLVFLLAAVAAVATLASALILAARGRRTRALRVTRALAICAAAYLAVGLTVSLLRPQRVMNVGDSWCFDDWCLEVENATRVPQPPADAYQVQLRLSSRARRVSQRANGAWVLLVDERGNRYRPEPAPSAVPLDVRLEPGQSISTARLFHVPPGAQNMGLVTGHGGPYCGAMSFLVIGESGCLFHKPEMIRMP